MAYLIKLPPLRYSRRNTPSRRWDMIYPDHPTFAMMKKNTKSVGENKVVAFKHGAPQRRAVPRSAWPRGNITPSQYKKVIVERKPGYAFAQIAGETIEAAATGCRRTLRTLKTEIDGAMYTAGRAFGMALFGNGGGARGQISATKRGDPDHHPRECLRLGEVRGWYGSQPERG